MHRYCEALYLINLILLVAEKTIRGGLHRATLPIVSWQIRDLDRSTTRHSGCCRLYRTIDFTEPTFLMEYHRCKVARRY